MSFASRAREEIAQRSLQKDCCVRAAAYGFACFAKYFDKGGLVLQTEQGTFCPLRCAGGRSGKAAPQRRTV